jgi:hypothetical protein
MKMKSSMKGGPSLYQFNISHLNKSNPTLQALPHQAPTSRIKVKKSGKGRKEASPVSLKPLISQIKASNSSNTTAINIKNIEP